MELSVRFDTTDEIVKTTAIGPITTYNIRDASRQALVIANEKKCNRLLIDITECTVSRSMMEGFMDMQNFMDITGLRYHHKCAIVFNPEHYPLERAQFMETVVRNRPNPIFRMFTDRAEALEWLKGFQ